MTAVCCLSKRLFSYVFLLSLIPVEAALSVPIVEFETSNLQQISPALFDNNEGGSSAMFVEDEQLYLSITEISDKTQILLLNSNGVNYPIFPQNGTHSSHLTLTPGLNDLTISAQNEVDFEISQRVILVDSWELTEVSSTTFGAEVATTILENAHIQSGQSFVTNNPFVQLEGTVSDNPLEQLQILGPDGQHIEIIENDKSFVAELALSSGSNVYTFINSYEGTPYKSTELTFKLNDPLSLTLNTTENPKGFIWENSANNTWTSSIPTFSLEGYVSFIQQGEIEIVFNGETNKTDVVDHQFRGQLRFTSNDPHAASVIIRAHASGTYYEETLSVDFSPIDGSFVSIQQIPFTNNFDEGSPDSSLATEHLITSATTIVHTPEITLGGNINININSEFNLQATVENLTTGITYPVNFNADGFRSSIRLAAGTNQIECWVSNGSHREKLSATAIVFSPELLVNGVSSENELPSTETGISISGSISFIQNGSIELRFENEPDLISVSVQNGDFEIDIPYDDIPNNSTSIMIIASDGEYFHQSPALKIPRVIPTSVEPSLDLAKSATEVETLTATANLHSEIDPEPQPEFEESDSTSDIAASLESETREVEMSTNPEMTLANSSQYSAPKPKRLFQPRSVADPNNRRDTLKGYVTLTFSVRKNGSVDPKNVSVVKSSHTALEKEAIRAIRKCRFTPATQDNEKVEVTTQMTLYWD